MDTPATLLHRLCNRAAPEDWERFIRLFTPLLRRWSLRFGMSERDAEDALQELFALLIVKLPDFRYDPSRSFRAWLWTLFRHSIAAWYKRQPRETQMLVDVESPDLLAEAAEAEYLSYLLAKVMQIVRSDFPDKTWRVFQRLAIEGQSGADVAREFDMTVNAVYLVRGRVLARLRCELTGLDR